MKNRVKTYSETDIRSQLKQKHWEEKVRCLSFRCDYWFRRKLHIGCLQDGVLLKDVLLGLVMTKGLQSKQSNSQSPQPTTGMKRFSLINHLRLLPCDHTDTGRKWLPQTTHPPYWRFWVVPFRPQSTQEASTLSVKDGKTIVIFDEAPFSEYWPLLSPFTKTSSKVAEQNQNTNLHLLSKSWM